jgi:hypothetical protein
MPVNIARTVAIAAMIASQDALYTVDDSICRTCANGEQRKQRND